MQRGADVVDSGALNLVSGTPEEREVQAKKMAGEAARTVRTKFQLHKGPTLSLKLGDLVPWDRYLAAPIAPTVAIGRVMKAPTRGLDALGGHVMDAVDKAWKISPLLGVPAAIIGFGFQFAAAVVAFVPSVIGSAAMLAIEAAHQPAARLFGSRRPKALEAAAERKALESAGAPEEAGVDEGPAYVLDAAEPAAPAPSRSLSGRRATARALDEGSREVMDVTPERAAAREPEGEIVGEAPPMRAPLPPSRYANRAAEIRARAGGPPARELE